MRVKNTGSKPVWKVAGCIAPGETHTVPKPLGEALLNHPDIVEVKPKKKAKK